MERTNSSNYRVTNVSTSSYTNWHGAGSSRTRTTHHQASERSNQISGMTFDDILGKETEKLCQLEK